MFGDERLKGILNESKIDFKVFLFFVSTCTFVITTLFMTGFYFWGIVLISLFIMPFLNNIILRGVILFSSFLLFSLSIKWGWSKISYLTSVQEIHSINFMIALPIIGLICLIPKIIIKRYKND